MVLLNPVTNVTFWTLIKFFPSFSCQSNQPEEMAINQNNAPAPKTYFVRFVNTPIIMFTMVRLITSNYDKYLHSSKCFAIKTLTYFMFSSNLQ